MDPGAPLPRAVALGLDVFVVGEIAHRVPPPVVRWRDRWQLLGLLPVQPLRLMAGAVVVGELHDRDCAAVMAHPGHASGPAGGGGGKVHHRNTQATVKQPNRAQVMTVEQA